MYIERNQRQNPRLPGRDYSPRGIYYLTICTFDRLELFGSINDGKLHNSPIGDVIVSQWLDLPRTFESLVLDRHVLMPNHFHGILVIRNTTERPATIGNIARQFKAKSTLEAKRIASDPELKLWQRGYYDHIVRDTLDLDRIREYIDANPANWETDEYKPKPR